MVTSAGLRTGPVADAERMSWPPKMSPTIGVTKVNGWLTETDTWFPMPPAKFDAVLQSSSTLVEGVKQVGVPTLREPSPPWAWTLASRAAAAVTPLRNVVISNDDSPAFSDAK
jgi:hypothetical protein